MFVLFRNKDDCFRDTILGLIYSLRFDEAFNLVVYFLKDWNL